MSFYRDAGNWKTWQTYVVEGELIYGEIEPYLESKEFFIGKDVQMEDLVFKAKERTGNDFLSQDDHPWQGLDEVRPATEAEALQAKEEHRFLGGAEELLQRFKKAQKANWPSQFEVTERIQELTY
jgi:hypothetical protein